MVTSTNDSSNQRALQTMEDSLYLIEFTKINLIDIKSFLLQIPQWKGSLEDAIVILVALRYQGFVWTYNFRDFSAFKTLNFWTP